MTNLSSGYRLSNRGRVPLWWVSAISYGDYSAITRFLKDIGDRRSRTGTIIRRRSTLECLAHEFDW